MAVDLTWETIAEQKVLWYWFRRGWTWEDFYSTKEQADIMLDDLDQPVPLVFDLRDAPDMPPGMITQAHKVAVTRHANGTPVVLFGASRVVQTTTSILRRMLGSVVHKFMGDVHFLNYDEELADLIITQRQQSQANL